MCSFVDISAAKAQLEGLYRHAVTEAYKIAENRCIAIAASANQALQQSGRGAKVERVQVISDKATLSVRVVADFADAKVLEYGQVGQAGLRYLGRSINKTINDTI